MALLRHGCGEAAGRAHEKGRRKGGPHLAFACCRNSAFAKFRSAPQQAQRVDAAARVEQRNASCGERDARSTSGTNRLQGDDMPRGAMRVWAIVRRSGQPNVVAGGVLCCGVVGPGVRRAVARPPAISDCPLERVRFMLLGRELVAACASGRCAPRPDVPTALAHATRVSRSRSGSARSRSFGIRQPLSNAASEEDGGIA